MDRGTLMRARITFLLPKVCTTLIAIAILGSPVRAGTQQSGSSEPVYRLTFTLRAGNGEQERSRSYEMTLQEEGEGRLRVLSKIPLSRGEEIDYVDIGAKIDAEFEERGELVLIEIEMHFTSLSESDASTRPELPEIEEWQSRVEVPIPRGEPTIVARSTTSDSGPRYELEVLAEKLR